MDAIAAGLRRVPEGISRQMLGAMRATNASVRVCVYEAVIVGQHTDLKT